MRFDVLIKHDEEENEEIEGLGAKILEHDSILFNQAMFRDETEEY